MFTFRHAHRDYLVPRFDRRRHYSLRNGCHYLPAPRKNGPPAQQKQLQQVQKKRQREQEQTVEPLKAREVAPVFPHQPAEAELQRSRTSGWSVTRETAPTPQPANV